jgi:hypothetical protein
MGEQSVESSTLAHDAKKLRTSEHVVSAEQATATILLDVRGGRYYTLNEVGGRIWALLSEGASNGEIVTCLANEFDVSPAELSADMESFIEQLRHSKLVVR